MEEKPNKWDWPKLTIGPYTVDVPIIQGGMGVGISLDGLAGAVAEAGAVGNISATLCGLNWERFDKDPIGATLRALDWMVRKARANARGLVGVNVMVAVKHFAELVQVAEKAGAQLFSCGAGLPLKLPGYVSDAGTAIAPIISSAQAAKAILKRWLKNHGRLADAVILEGPMAGGHLGFAKEDIFKPEYQLERLVPEVLAVLEEFEQVHGRKIPLIAAGGIYDGADIYRFIKMGASGVQMGTRFVATFECDASDAFKQAYLDAKKEDVVIIDSPVGLPGRAIRNAFLDKVARGEKDRFRCFTQCMEKCPFNDGPYCISRALINAQNGDLENGFAFCGANVHRVDSIISVRELIDELHAGYLAEALLDNGED